MCLCSTIRFVLLVVSFWRYNLICPDSSIFTHGRIEATSTSLCVTIRFGLLLTTIFHHDVICPMSYYRQYDTVCPSIGNHLFAMRSDFSRQQTSLFIMIRFVLLLKTVFHCDMICPDSC